VLFRSSFTRPSAGFSTNDASLVNGDAIITSPSGRVKGTFSIPDPKISGNPQFRTGQVSFRLTSSPTNIVSTDPVTAGETNYSAVGILQTEQETIIATRNAELRRISVSQSTEIRSEIQFFNNDINDSDIGDGSAADASAGVSGATSGATGGVSGACTDPLAQTFLDRKSTRLNSSTGYISYAVFCLKNKNYKTHSKPKTNKRITDNVKLNKEVIR